MGFVSILLKAKFKNALHLCKIGLSNGTIELGPRNSQLDCLVVRSKDLVFRPDPEERLEYFIFKTGHGNGVF